ncbi:FKBP-type peptidyl-prolyl cis-trans isomerase [Leadbetterella byssophila]|uniref:peptidylprolyl isomerase n=1 Tax=Leadbetterella byssophila (strain DSM 17132 / JCM 16389 / KACC 11308 / NBRC 106382 / 4M15) TaxID=649349 RepID=E4RS08_LEAB4|nr:FKBP-type peptidyl-prolyl cis-trans isomerase [Leadbetterella byssophila]ADQ18540.1 peptidylprolyl isomerase (FKBP-type peptidyl-prolyl cis-trans isomerase) [Leadbetterella byssophila DSM 17132]
MKISNGKVVSTAYTLYTSGPGDDFELVEEVGEDEAMFYLAGNSGLPPKFEENLNGLEAGDTYNFEISPEDGFGEFYDDNVVDFSLDMFKIEDGQVPAGFLEPGNPIPFTNDEGAKIQGRVVEVKEDVVIIDFNHPLAGKTLKFEGKVLTVREATSEELDHGHVHGPGGHHHH